MDKFCKDCKHSFKDEVFKGYHGSKPYLLPMSVKIMKCYKNFTVSKDNIKGEVKVYKEIEEDKLNPNFDCKDFEPIEPKRSWWSRLFKRGK